jgi:hypothetical protein
VTIPALAIGRRQRVEVAEAPHGPAVKLAD